jgi:hypothetical protein
LLKGNERGRFREDVHGCAMKMIIDLLALSDIHNKPSNLGVKTTQKTLEDGSKEIKHKPFVIDFTLASDYRKLHVSDMLNNLTASEGGVDRTYFAFKNSPDVIESALRKVFIGDNGENKFLSFLNEAKEDVKSRFSSMDDIDGKHLDAKYLVWEGRCNRFFEGATRYLKEQEVDANNSFYDSQSSGPASYNSSDGSSPLSEEKEDGNNHSFNFDNSQDVSEPNTLTGSVPSGTCLNPNALRLEKTSHVKQH